MSETTRTQLCERPIREVRRLFKLYLSREKAPNAKANFSAVVALATVALLHPRVRKAFRAAVTAIPMDKWKWLQLDNGDRYHVLFRADYDFLGFTFEERSQILTEVHTVSKCCGAKANKNNLTGEWLCSKCDKYSDTEVRYPPEIEIAP